MNKDFELTFDGSIQTDKIYAKALGNKVTVEFYPKDKWVQEIKEMDIEKFSQIVDELIVVRNKIIDAHASWNARLP